MTDIPALAQPRYWWHIRMKCEGLVKIVIMSTVEVRQGDLHGRPGNWLG